MAATNVFMLRTVFIFCTLAGGFILIKIIPLIVRMLVEKPLLSVPVAQQRMLFRLPASGSYAIWQKSRSMFKSRTEAATPAIFEVPGGGGIALHKTLAMITANDGSGTRLQLYTFSVPSEGEYRIELKADSSAVNIGSDFSFEIRKPIPVLKLVFSVLGIIAGAALLIGGIVLAFLVPQLF